ncbi:hypothetical protein Ddc_15566 [Ditylenchus destructor]|nr:hypothetical protein Ddc_15566 [Ditylenchus destructor]
MPSRTLRGTPKIDGRQCRKKTHPIWNKYLVSEETVKCSTFKPPSNTSNLMDHWSRKHKDEEWPVGGQKTILRASPREQLQLAKQAAVKHAQEDTATTASQEIKQPVQFQQGMTNRGATCLWYHEFRFLRTRKDGNWYRCEQRSCRATLLVKDMENSTGVLGPNEHNHAATPSRQRPETSKQPMKQEIQENPVDLLGLVQGFVDDLRVPKKEEDENETLEE